MGNTHKVCLFGKCKLNEVVNTPTGLILRSKIGLKPSAFFPTEESFKYFEEEMRNSKISTSKFYKAEKEDSSFFMNSDKNYRLEEIIQNHDKNNSLERQICGYHRFLRAKQNWLIKEINKLRDKFESNQVDNKEASKLFEDTKHFLQCFLREHQRVVYPILPSLLELLNYSISKPVGNANDSELTLQMRYLKAIRPFFYRFNIMRAISEDTKNMAFKSEVNTTTWTALDLILTRYFTLNKAMLLYLFDEEKNGGAVAQPKKLALHSHFLNILVHLFQSSNSETLIGNPCFAEFGEILWNRFEELLYRFGFFLEQVKEPRLIHDLLFYISSLLNQYLLISPSTLATLTNKKAMILEYLTLWFDSFGINTLQSLILMIFLNLGNDVRESMGRIGRFELMQSYKAQGIDMGVEKYVGDTTFLGFLSKVRSVKSILPLHLKRYIENNEPDYFEIGRKTQ